MIKLFLILNVFGENLLNHYDGKDAMGNPEKKISPNFTSWSDQKHAKGKTLWNKEGMRFF